MDCGRKLKPGSFILIIKRGLFTLKIVEHWSKLRREVVQFPFLEISKTQMEKSLRNLA